MLDFIKNLFLSPRKYRIDSDAVIVTCFFNPQRSPYRSKAFKLFYESIKHLNYRIVECVIDGSEPELDINTDKNITQLHSGSMLWHKEGLLNYAISKLPKKYKYVFWLDADVLFDNPNWLVESCKVLEGKMIMQPFDCCVHLDKDQTEPSFDVHAVSKKFIPNMENSKVWRSFCSNYVKTSLWDDNNYNIHGHVGFAWGARREVFDKIMLYDRALIGGADHIMAHAAAGQINHPCITKSFTDNIDEINSWSEDFYDVVRGMIGYTQGNLFHVWHGDVEKRQYLKRIQEFTPKSKNICEKDENGLYIGDESQTKYVKEYIKKREVPTDDGLFLSLIPGYVSNDVMMSDTIGDLITESPFDPVPEVEFGGGEFGGGGAESEWGGSNDQSSIDNDNFS